MADRIQPDYEKQHTWESYAADLPVEYRQCLEEGRDVAAYADLFGAVSRLPAGAHKARLADALYELVTDAPMRPDYPYREPDALEEIRELRPAAGFAARAADEKLEDRLRGAWLGRICGCLLGKTVEGIRTEELHPLLRASGNWPMHRYIRSTDATEEMRETYQFDLKHTCYADRVECMPADDDTNYTVLYQVLIDRYGRDFTPEDVMRVWLDSQPKRAYCTAERVAYCNFVKGYTPPASALWQNPYREWIGAQIRGDYFGYINPGDPEAAAGMAWRDACVSHVKNGIYGEMFAAAMLAAAAVESDIEGIIRAGLSQIPETSRLYEAVSEVIASWRAGRSEDETFAMIAARWDEHSAHDWCHTISNAMIVAAALLYGGGDYGRSVCRAVQAGFDTDCNGATVGSVLGMRGGAAAIGPEWLEPIHGQLDTAIFGIGRVRVEELVQKTLAHVRGNSEE